MFKYWDIYFNIILNVYNIKCFFFFVLYTQNCKFLIKSILNKCVTPKNFILLQKFKSSTRRRQRLEEQQSPSACNMQTPQTRSRQLLGRTPTKLYSPFGIESPRHAWDKENEVSTPMRASSPECGTRYIQCRPFRFTKAKGFSMLR